MVALFADESAKAKVDTSTLLFEQAEAMGLEPTWVLPKGLFAISVEGRERYVNFVRSPLNSHIGISLAKDKFLTRLVLERHSVRNIPFARPQTHDEAVAFLDEHETIIAKPVSGFGSKDIHIVTAAQQLMGLRIENYILEKYITGRELRYLVLNDEVIGVHRSEYGVSVDEFRPLERISYPEDDWDAELVAQSLSVARVLGLAFAAVDYLVDDSGCAYILEVNTSPGLKWFHAPSSGPVVDVAKLFMEALVEHESASVERMMVAQL